MQAINPIKTHTKFGKDRINTFPSNERKPSAGTPDDGKAKIICPPPSGVDIIPSVTMGTCKRKFLMNSNMTLTVLNLHQQTDPKVQQDFKGQYSKVKGQSVSHHDVAHLKLSTNVPTKYNLPYSLDKIL